MKFNLFFKIIVVSFLAIILTYLGFDRLRTSEAINYYLKWSFASELHTRIYSFKWLAAIYYSGANFIFSSAVIWILYPQKKTLIILIGFYSCLVMITAIIYSLGILFSMPERGYFVAHRIMEIVQSPIPLLMSISLGYMLNKQEKNKD